MEKNIQTEAFSLGEMVIWDSGFGYEIGYFRGEGHVYNTYLIDTRSGRILEPTCYSKDEVYRYSNELVTKLSIRYVMFFKSKSSIVAGF